MKLLSVVVPCYNSQDYMEACIDSLLVGGDRIEIIIIDDGSTDGTAALSDAYAQKYPEIVKVVHQKNGGHGAGINAGLAHATGRYFKIVDSDDYVSADLPRFLDLLEGQAHDADLVINNYVYTYKNGAKDDPMRYHKQFPADRLIGWEETRKFPLRKYLMIHSCAFRTELVKKNFVPLPEHVFYEDNLYMCRALQKVEKLYYWDVNLNYYTIGRPGQSFSTEAMTKRYEHNLLVAEQAFLSCDLQEIKKKSGRLYALLYHEFQILFGIASNFARRSKEPDSDEKLAKMWESCRVHDAKTVKKMKRYPVIFFLNVPGRAGKVFARMLYRIAHLVVKFN